MDNPNRVRISRQSKTSIISDNNTNTGSEKKPVIPKVASSVKDQKYTPDRDISQKAYNTPYIAREEEEPRQKDNYYSSAASPLSQPQEEQIADNVAEKKTHFESPVRVHNEARASILDGEMKISDIRPSEKKENIHLKKPIRIHDKARVSILEDNTKASDIRPIAKTGQTRSEKPIQIHNEAKVSILEDDLKTSDINPTEKAENRHLKKSIRIHNEPRVSILEGDPKASDIRPFAKTEQSRSEKPVRIHSEAKVSILKGDSKAPDIRSSEKAEQAHSEKPARIHDETRVSILKSDSDASSSEVSPRLGDMSGASQLKSEKTNTKRSKIIERKTNSHRNDGSQSAGQLLKKTAVNGAASAAGGIAKEAAAAPIKTHKIAADKALEQGKQSTDFDDNGNNSPNAEAAAIAAIGIKKLNAPEKMISSARQLRDAPRRIRKNVSRIHQNAKRTNQAARGIAHSTQEMKLAVENFKKAQYVNSLVSQSKSKAAWGSVKNVSELAINITKEFLYMVTNALKTVIHSSAIVWYFVAALVVIIVMAVAVFGFLFSGYGIFFADDMDNPITIEEIVRNINTDYQRKLEQTANDYDTLSVALTRYEGSKTQWKYILALYAVKYSSEGEDILTVDDKTEEKIKEIFYMIHSISANYVTEENPHAQAADAPPDVNPYWTVLVITTTAKGLSDVMDNMKFTDEQRREVMEIVGSDTEELWNNVLYGHDGNGGPALAKIAKGQIGQPPQAYTSWTGIANGRDVEWSGSFVCWCANEAGYVTQGLYPQTNDKYALIDWFKERGLWENPDKEPNIGDTVFISSKGNDECSRCGIIYKIENERVYYITNDDEIVGIEFQALKNLNSTIMGYGILPPMTGLRGDTVEEKIYNYLRQEGYSAVSACAVLANIQGDCGCDPAQFAQDHGYYTGIFKWNGTEMTEFMEWCSDNAYDWRNLESQLFYYEKWIKDLEINGYWGSNSTKFHPNITAVTTTNGFKAINANSYDGDIAQALYAATVIFTDDISRPNYLSGDEAERYSYSVAFYNYLVSNSVDGSTVSAWRPESAAEIGVFHLY